MLNSKLAFTDGSGSLDIYVVDTMCNISQYGWVYEKCNAPIRWDQPQEFLTINLHEHRIWAAEEVSLYKIPNGVA